MAIRPLALDRSVGFPARLVPLVSSLVFALMSVVPLHIPGLAVVMPTFALMAVFHWTVYRPDLLSSGAVFIIGLVLDLLNGTPYLGVSAIALLLARTGVLSQRQHFVNRAFPALWLGFVAVAAGVFALEWALVGLLHAAVLDLRPFVFQAVLTAASFPLGSALLARAHRAF